MFSFSADMCSDGRIALCIYIDAYVDNWGKLMASDNPVQTYKIILVFANHVCV